MALKQNSEAVAAALAHVEAWSNHDFETARKGLADDVWVTAVTIDPQPPKADLKGADDYMRGLIEFAQAVVPGSSRILASSGDEQRALLMLTVRVKFGMDAPEMTLPGARIYQLDADGKIKVEHVIFFVAPD